MPISSIVAIGDELLGDEVIARGGAFLPEFLAAAAPEPDVLALQRAVGAPSEPQMERMMIVHAQVQEFRVRYFDGQTWYAEWQRAELPRAVEITLIVQSAGAPVRASRFATLVTAD